MLSNEPLNEQEMRFLGALKLFMEADPKYEAAGNVLDEMTPEQQRYMINVYHQALEDPRALYIARAIYPWVAPILTPYFWIRGLFKRKK